MNCGALRDMESNIRLAYLVTHPIQYQAPLLRRIAAEPGIDLTVFFCSDFSLRSYLDPDFGKTIAWDIPLTEGYKYEILPALGRRDRVSFWRPFNYGLARRLSRGNFDVLWVHGYNRWFHWRAMAGAKIRGLKVLVRDEATGLTVPRSYLKRLGKRWFFLGLRKCVDGFLAIGTLNAEYYRSYGIAAERIFPVPYAVDNTFFKIGPGRPPGSGSACGVNWVWNRTGPLSSLPARCQRSNAVRTCSRLISGCHPTRSRSRIPTSCSSATATRERSWKNAPGPGPGVR